MTLVAVVDWDHTHWQEFTRVTPPHEGLMIESIRTAGEGNMNLTLRLQFESGSVIAKHAPPFCFKFPTISAPVERLSVELEFFKLASLHPKLQDRFPRVHHHDQSRNIALMEDLGECQDYGSIYEGMSIEQEHDLKMLVDILSDLHGLDLKKIELKNEKMRRLNHEYIFSLPFTDTAFDLTPYFKEQTPEALEFKTSGSLKEAFRHLGELYLKDGVSLVHGDFYPRSWLKTKRGVCVIDPEFGFKGLAEFDVGVFIAHLKMAKVADQKITAVLHRYSKPNGFQMPLAYAFAGCEIIRRLLHVAQLPLHLSPEEKITLLVQSKQMIYSGVIR